LGYSLYLVRSTPIQTSELEALLGPGDDGCFHYKGLILWISQGQLEYRGRQESDLALLLELAERLGARVQGDDGETYPLPPSGPSRTRPAFWDRMRMWALKKIQPVKDPPFRAGEQVRDLLSGRIVTVESVEGGPLPTVTFRAPDGTVHKRALNGSGLESLSARD
jgi:hypothetical protein